MKGSPPPPSPPIEPPATHVKFPDPRRARGREVLAVGMEFSPGTLLAAYRIGEHCQRAAVIDLGAFREHDQ